MQIAAPATLPGQELLGKKARAGFSGGPQENMVSASSHFGGLWVLINRAGSTVDRRQVVAPTTKYKYVHILPLPTIKMDKVRGGAVELRLFFVTGYHWSIELWLNQS